MKTKKLNEIIQMKNDVIMEQTRRIRLLEEKMAELRQKYFRLKYSDVVFHLRHQNVEI